MKYLEKHSMTTLFRKGARQLRTVSSLISCQSRSISANSISAVVGSQGFQVKGLASVRFRFGARGRLFYRNEI